MYMHKRWIVLMAVGLLSILVMLPAIGARKTGAIDALGVPLYVIIEVTWDGTSPSGDWTVWGPKWDPVVETGAILSSCTYCLEIASDFTFHGKTVHFDEIYVDTVHATPQVRHVVLHDNDGNGTYTGTIPGEHYFPWAPESDGSWAILYIDRIEYEITFDEDGNVTYYRYLQYEHKKLE